MVSSGVGWGGGWGKGRSISDESLRNLGREFCERVKDNAIMKRKKSGRGLERLLWSAVN